MRRISAEMFFFVTIVAFASACSTVDATHPAPLDDEVRTPAVDSSDARRIELTLSAPASGMYRLMDTVTVSARVLDHRGHDVALRAVKFETTSAKILTTGSRSAVVVLTSSVNEVNAYFVNGSGSKIDARTFIAAEPATTEQSSPAEMIVWTPGVGVERIPAPPGVGFISPMAINDRGEVVGYYASSEQSLLYRGYFWSRATGYVEIVGSAPSQRMIPVDINNDGLVAGTSWFTDQTSQAFLWRRDRGFSALTDREHETMAGGVNSAGDVAGTRNGRPFLWNQANGFVQLPGAGDSEDSPLWTAYGIDVNDQGHVLASWAPGYSPGIDYTWLPWSAPTIWKEGAKSDLGCKDCLVSAINNHGVVVGHKWGGSHAFKWTAEAGLETLPVTVGWGVAVAVNDAGTIAGSTMTWNGKTISNAAAWTAGGFILMDSIAGVKYSEARDINSHGQVVVYVR